ncbi:Maf family protein [Inquilinus limosus]|uniref:Maf family protein n=1 Tax=Inquilinus limosus TaxID=171674 RepID=UPI003F5CCEA3
MGALVLASGSATRRMMLEAAGVAVTVSPAAIDEAEVKASMKAEGASPADVAEALAVLKAQRASRRRPGALVIGADQMLDCDGVWYDKPADRAAARDQLLALCGRTHTLTSTAVAVRDGERVWHATDRARLTMRPFSHVFLEGYLDAVGDAVLSSVGGYQLEGRGAQLFAKVEGDHFTILGLPLLPLLGFLRDHGVLPS